MTSTNSSYLSVSSGHVDDLINYVLDVKPYHTKLSQIVEEFLFTDEISVGIVEDQQLLAFLGADVLGAVAPPFGQRARRYSKSWTRDEISDGQRRTFPVPLTISPKKSSHFSQDTFVCGVDDDSQIAGLVRGAFNQKRWNGPGVITAHVNDMPMAESIDYHLSYGAFSFDIRESQKWKPLNLSNLASVPGISDDLLPDRYDDSYALKFPEQPGYLRYDSIIRSYGTISDIVGGNYEEWILTCIEEDIPVLEVRGSLSGVIGTVTQASSFISPLISFSFSKTPGEDFETISLGQQFVLTPAGRVVVHPDAPQEVWTIIKTNPQALDSAPVYSRNGNALSSPGIQIHTKSLDFCVPSVWTIDFIAGGQYVINGVANDGYPSLAGYPKTVDLKDGCSYKDEHIHFTLLPDANGFYIGDRIDFIIKEKIDNFLVYGSTSGWQPAAKLDEYYWNGKIGFKIPGLKYFAKSYNATIVTSDDASPSSWTTVIANPQVLNSIAHVNGSFIVSGEDSIVGSSLDGYAWSSDLTGLANTGEVYVVIGEKGKIVSSTDGETWYSRVSHTNQNLNAVAHIPDLLTPQPYPPGPANTVNSIIVVGDRGTIITSINGEGWSPRNSGTSENLNDIAWSDDGIFAVGSNGIIIKSLDRISWSPVSVDINEFPNSIAHDLNSIIYEPISNVFVVVGDNGTVLRSADGGLTWVRPALPSGFDSELNAVAFGENKFVAVGRGGFTVVSNDGGLVWNGYESPKLNDIAFGDGVFSAVGGKRGDNTLFIPIKPISSVAEPSVYTITFQASAADSTAGAMTATVQHNLSGFKRGLIVDQPWYDEHVAFTISSGGGTVTYLPGDTVKVYLAPSHIIAIKNGYDVVSFDDSLYDVAIADLELPITYNEEIYPLYHSHGTVIFPNITDGDIVKIQKAFSDNVRLRIEGAGIYHRELAAVNDWIPLEFRFFDRLVNGIPSSENNDFDLATYIEAYLASDPTVKVFAISQPRFEKTDRPASAQLTFDQSFFQRYIGFNTRFTLKFLPDESYGQHIRVKVSENFTTYARVRLMFDDVSSVSISDTINYWDIQSFLDVIDTVSVQFAEGGAFPFGGYDVLPYDSWYYDRLVRGEYVFGVIENPPGSGNYEYTGDTSDWIRPAIVGDAPGISVKENQSNEISGTTFVEGLTIIERDTSSMESIARISAIYDVDTHTALGGLLITDSADSYLITHNFIGSTPSLIVESLNNPGVYINPIPDLTPYAGAPGAISFKSFSFTVPNGTAPFKLILA